MLDIDKISMLVTVDTDLSIREIERGLVGEGYTLNYHAIPSNSALLVDVLNNRIPNLYADAYGGIEDLCVQVCLARPDGALLRNLLVPRSATGPSLKKIAIGSGELLGVPIQATLKIFYRPHRLELAFALFSGSRQRDFFLQSLKRNGIRLPLVTQISQQTAEKHLQGVEEKAKILGLAFWGEDLFVRRQLAYLQSLAHRKKGEWYTVEDEKIKKHLMRVLHREAVENFLAKAPKAGDVMSPSCLATIRKIQGVS